MVGNVMSYSHVRIPAAYLPGHGNSIVPSLSLCLTVSRNSGGGGIETRFGIYDQDLTFMALSSNSAATFTPA
jgi:hypothetical protein